mgnify:CR=1 FL=1
MSQEGTQQAFGGCIDANSDNKTEASLLAARFAEDHYEEVFRYCARRLPSREDAQDATQEVFLRLVKSHALYERNGKPLAYLGIACLYIMKSVKHRQLRQRVRPMPSSISL